MEQRPLTQEEPPDTGWRGGGTPPLTLSRQRKRQTLVKTPEIRGSGTLIPQPDALIILSNK